MQASETLHQTKEVERGVPFEDGASKGYGRLDPGGLNPNEAPMSLDGQYGRHIHIYIYIHICIHPEIPVTSGLIIILLDCNRFPGGGTFTGQQRENLRSPGRVGRYGSAAPSLWLATHLPIMCVASACRYLDPRKVWNQKLRKRASWTLGQSLNGTLVWGPGRRTSRAQSVDSLALT